MQRSDIRFDIQAGVTVGLVAVPQSMAFAVIAGLQPMAGLYSAIVMGVLSAAISRSSKVNVGPAVTTCTLVFAVLATAAPGRTDQWSALAGLLAVIVGLMTVLAALLRVGQFVRFVPRSVLVGLVAGSAILIFGTQLPPFLGLPAQSRATLAVNLWSSLEHLPELSLPATLMAAGTLAAVLVGVRVFPRFPTAFVAIVAGGVVTAVLEETVGPDHLQSIGAVPSKLPVSLTPAYEGAYGTDLLVGAAAITLIGIIQTLAIVRAFAERSGERVDPRRELLALGIANCGAGLLHGFPGAGSFARSALNDIAGARTRLSRIVAPITVAAVVLIAGPWARFITKPAIAGLLMATAGSIVNWREFGQILRRGGDDRIVLATMMLCVFVLPIHWAVLIGLALSIVFFLRRVSRLQLAEMVWGEENHFLEQQVDRQTGTHAVTLLQIEGPLFFAHADEIVERLGAILQRGPRVVILRMRRTQHIDFSVIMALDRVCRDYRAAGGEFIICGLTKALRNVLSASPLGKTLTAEHLLQTTRKVFGSAHAAIRMALRIVGATGDEHSHFRPAAPTLNGDEPESISGSTGP